MNYRAAISLQHSLFPGRARAKLTTTRLRRMVDAAVPTLAALAEGQAAARSSADGTLISAKIADEN